MPPEDQSPADAAPAPVAYHPALMEDLHRNIASANSYRMELIKFSMAISAALLTFTVTFRPTLEIVQLGWVMWASWGALALSLVGGMANMMGWDRFYMSYRDVDYKEGKSLGRDNAQAKGKQQRAQINRWRRAAMWAQFVGFAVGVVGAAVFAAANIDQVRKADSKPAQVNLVCSRAPGNTVATAAATAATVATAEGTVR